MARNRKNVNTGVRLGPAVKAIGLCLLIGLSGVGYVWQKQQIYSLARQIEEREIRLKKLQDENAKLSKHLATLRSPALLQNRIAELHLGLVQPLPAQIVRLVEPAPPPTAEIPEPAPSVRLVAGRSDRTVANP